MNMRLSGKGVLLLRLMRVGLGLVLLLVLQPSRVRLGVLVLMREDVLGLRLKHCDQKGRIRRFVLMRLREVEGPWGDGKEPKLRCGLDQRLKGQVLELGASVMDEPQFHIDR